MTITWQILYIDDDPEYTTTALEFLNDKTIQDDQKIVLSTANSLKDGLALLD